jgi:hypothetical protein
MSVTASFEITGWDETTYDAPGRHCAARSCSSTAASATTPSGHIVPGSGTGELAGLSGEAVYAHDDAGARLTLSYALAARS